MTFEHHQQAINAAATVLNDALQAAAIDGFTTLIIADTWVQGGARAQTAFVRHVQISTNVKPDGAMPPPKPR